MYEIRHYLSASGEDVYLEWLKQVRDPIARVHEMKDRAHDEAMAELFHKDPAFATQYLNSVLEEGEQADLLIALRQMAKAFGGVTTVAAKAHLNPTQLYRTLSPEGNPELRSLTAVLRAMGLRLAVEPLQQP